MNAQNPTVADLPVSEEGDCDNLHYLRAVTDMAERCKVVAQDAVYTDKGIKLLEKGARVDSRLYERLVQHKLRGSIDSQLSVENAVNVPSLIAAARRQCAQDPLPMLLSHALGGPDRLLAPLQSLALPQPMAFKLTVMREQRPDLLAHSLRMALMSLYLGVQSGWSERECIPLAAAALLHDIGVLHMDPVWRDPDHKVTGAGRKHLVAHPVSAMLMVRAQAYAKSVETAVLEHHERMDGTGYPRSLQGNAISPMGQILMLAEVASAFFEKYQDDAPAQRLSLSLRLNHRKFSAPLTSLLLPLLQQAAVGQGGMQAEQPLSAKDEAAQHIATLADAFQAWDDARKTLPAAWLALPSGRACAFVDMRLTALQKALYEAGSHPRQQAEMLVHLEGDAQGMAELELLNREAIWQLQSILNASHSRWPLLSDRADAGDACVADWQDQCTQLLAAMESDRPH